MFYYYFYKQNFKIKKPYIFILSIGIISSASMALSPSYHSGTNLFLYICMIIFVLSIINYSTLPDLFLYITLISTLLLFSFLYNKHNYINDHYIKTEKSILKQKREGKKQILVNKIDIQTNRLINYYAIEADSSMPRNKNISRYYKIMSIRSID